MALCTRARASPPWRARTATPVTTAGRPSSTASAVSHASPAGLHSSSSPSRASRSSPGDSRAGTGCDVRSTARRRPSARSGTTAASVRVSAGEKWSRSAVRRSVRPPQAAPPRTSAARSSSPKPCGARTSRWRLLRSRLPPVASARPAACDPVRARASKRFTSSPLQLDLGHPQRRLVRERVLDDLARRDPRRGVQRDQAVAVEADDAAEDARRAGREVADAGPTAGEGRELAVQALGREQPPCHRVWHRPSRAAAIATAARSCAA